MVVSRLALASATEELQSAKLSDEVELYQRTYNTLLRSSGETALRVLESSHRAIGSSLHPLADSDVPDLGAFIYAIRRLPDGIAGADIDVVAYHRRAGIANAAQAHHYVVADAAVVAEFRVTADDDSAAGSTDVAEAD